jgi:hypothetical protein
MLPSARRCCGRCKPDSVMLLLSRSVKLGPARISSCHPPCSRRLPMLRPYPSPGSRRRAKREVTQRLLLTRPVENPAGLLLSPCHFRLSHFEQVEKPALLHASNRNRRVTRNTMNIETGRALLAERFQIVAPPEGVRAPAPNVTLGLGRDLLSAAWTSGPFEKVLFL